MLTRRHVEVITGLCVALLGAVTAYGSLENGIGWTDFGPASGYFPFRIGILLLALGLVIAARYALSHRRRAPTQTAPEVTGPAALHDDAGLDVRFMPDGAIGRIGSILVPTTICAALIPWPGLYLSGGLFLVFSIITLGKTGFLKALAISVGVMAAFFFMFEWWFQVPLAKGIIMPAIGIY